MEIFVRLADQKFIKHGESTTFFDAINCLFNKYLIPEFGPTDPNIWREEVLYKEENDLALKR